MNLVAPTRIMAAPERAAFFERAQRTPGGRAGRRRRPASSPALPLRDGGWQGTMTIEDRPDLRDGREPNALYRIVSPGYFRAMGITRRAGPDLQRHRRRRRRCRSGIVSAVVRGEMWPDRDPIGRRVRHRFSDEPTLGHASSASPRRRA